MSRDYIGLDDLPDCCYPIIILEPILCYHTRWVNGTRIMYNDDLNPLRDQLATIIRIEGDE